MDAKRWPGCVWPVLVQQRVKNQPASRVFFRSYGQGMSDPRTVLVRCWPTVAKGEAALNRDGMITRAFDSVAYICGRLNSSDHDDGGYCLVDTTH